ncbi:uncharacterized protein isoform X2 [Choristoneura fumiferana]|uniref:uncharacterized protein isoform X2 n=1 Tax=Choristoneura fumiferana TaxID=7141 RepID=UPI003D153F38
MAPVDLMKINSEELAKFLDSFDHVISDCDGVLWASEPLPGVGDFIKFMKQIGKKVHFLSNNSIRSDENYSKFFKNAGIEDGIENLTIPSKAIAEYLKSINFDKHVYCVTCQETIKTLEANGFKCKYGPDVGYDSFPKYGEYLVDDPEIGAVVFDSDYKVNMPKMYKAQAYLRRPEVLFINGPTDKYVPFGDGLALGVAAFTDLVAEYTGRTPIGLGKPSKLYGEIAMKRAGVTDASRVLFIGDMIEQDVALGKNVGFKTLLVLTHFTEEKMLAHTIQPDFYAPCLGSLVPILNKHGKKYLCNL